MNWVNGVAAEIDLVVVCGIGGLGLSPVIRINISITKYTTVVKITMDWTILIYTLSIKSNFIDVRNHEKYNNKHITKKK